MEEKNSNKKEESMDVSTTQVGKKEEKKRRMWIEISIYIILLFICGYIIPRFVLQRTIIDGSSMETNLYDNENVLVEKVSKHFKNYDRFDIIVFYPYGKGTKDYYVKRVIGLPGETIQIKDGIIYINGEELNENYGKDPIEDGGIAEKPIVLADDEYFVLGDNRRVSKDSRIEDVGPVSKDKIGGKVILRIWPFSKFGFVK
nr:signal peptidase I [Clostridium sp. Marseille-P299]